MKKTLLTVCGIGLLGTLAWNSFEYVSPGKYNGACINQTVREDGTRYCAGRRKTIDLTIRAEEGQISDIVDPEKLVRVYYVVDPDKVDELYEALSN